MSPIDQTIFAVGLFLALVALWMWSKRRRRISRVLRGTILAASLTQNREGE
jgi:hypothetical protein